MILINLRLEILRWCLICFLLFLILSFQILIVEIRIQEFFTIHPCSNHMWIFFMKMSWSRFSIDKNIFTIKSNMICFQCIISPKNHLTPKIWMLSWFMHCSIWLKCLLNIIFIFIKHYIYIFLLCIWIIENLIKVSSYLVLFIMKTVEVYFLYCMNMLRHQFSKNTLI